MPDPDGWEELKKLTHPAQLTIDDGTNTTVADGTNFTVNPGQLGIETPGLADYQFYVDDKPWRVDASPNPERIGARLASYQDGEVDEEIGFDPRPDPRLDFTVLDDDDIVDIAVKRTPSRVEKAFIRSLTPDSRAEYARKLRRLYAQEAALRVAERRLAKMEAIGDTTGVRERLDAEHRELNAKLERLTPQADPVPAADEMEVRLAGVVTRFVRDISDPLRRKGMAQLLAALVESDTLSEQLADTWATRFSVDWRGGL